MLERVDGAYDAGCKIITSFETISCAERELEGICLHAQKALEMRLNSFKKIAEKNLG